MFRTRAGSWGPRARVRRENWSTRSTHTAEKKARAASGREPRPTPRAGGWRRSQGRWPHARAAALPATYAPGKGAHGAALRRPPPLGPHPPPFTHPSPWARPTAGWGGGTAGRGRGVPQEAPPSLSSPFSSGGTGASPDRPARAVRGHARRDTLPLPSREWCAAAEGGPRIPLAGCGWGVRRGRKKWTEPTRPNHCHRGNKLLCRGLTFNRSQRGSCSAMYETPTQKGPL